MRWNYGPVVLVFSHRWIDAQLVHLRERVYHLRYNRLIRDGYRRCRRIIHVNRYDHTQWLYEYVFLSSYR